MSWGLVALAVAGAVVREATKDRVYAPAQSAEPPTSENRKFGARAGADAGLGAMKGPWLNIGSAALTAAVGIKGRGAPEGEEHRASGPTDCDRSTSRAP